MNILMNETWQIERKTFGTNALNADKCALCNIPGGVKFLPNYAGLSELSSQIHMIRLSSTARAKVKCLSFINLTGVMCLIEI